MLAHCQIVALYAVGVDSPTDRRRLERCFYLGESSVDRVAGIFVRKYTLRRYAFFFKEIEVRSVEFSTPR